MDANRRDTGNTEILLSGGTITNSESYDMVILQGVQLHVNNATVSGKIQTVERLPERGMLSLPEQS